MNRRRPASWRRTPCWPLTRTLGAQHPHTLSARQRVRPYWDFEAYLG
ncbi:hypothetical protein LT493_20315 [Streptomyces tricolor]|nr:hypothetical protein [Streptomyces tricolor]